MKTRNLKSELRLKQKLITRAKGAPAYSEGKDGDFTVRYIEGRGLFLFYKWGQNWYGSRMSIYTSKRSERQESVYLPVGKKATKVGELCLDTDNKVKINKGSKREHLLSIDKDNIVDAKKPIFLKRTDQEDMDADEAKDPTILIENTGHAHMRFYTPRDADTGSYIWDQFSTYGTVHPETFSDQTWVVGLDTSTNTFKFMYRGGGSGSGSGGNHGKLSGLTPSSGDSREQLSITSSGMLRLGIITNAATDTDKFLVSDNINNGYVKFRTGAEVRADIDANTHYLTREVSGRLPNLNWHAGGTDLGTTSLSASDWDLGTNFNIASRAIYIPVHTSTIHSIRWIGGVDTTATYEAELWDVTIPSDGTAAASTAARIGSTYALGSVTADTWKQVLNAFDINHSLVAGHALFMVLRCSAGLGTKNINGSLTVKFSI